MSLEYIEQIGLVERDYAAAVRAFGLAIETWGAFEPDSMGQLGRPLTRSTFIDAANRLDDTFFVRLTAEFEGILKRHLRTNHPTVKFPGSRSNIKVDWLIGRVRANEPDVVIDPDLRKNLDGIRDYRNDLAHREQTVAAITFASAIKTYRRLLKMVAEPGR